MESTWHVYIEKKRLGLTFKGIPPMQSESESWRKGIQTRTQYRCGSTQHCCYCTIQSSCYTEKAYFIQYIDAVAYVYVYTHIHSNPDSDFEHIQSLSHDTLLKAHCNLNKMENYKKKKDGSFALSFTHSQNTQYNLCMANTRRAHTIRIKSLR